MAISDKFSRRASRMQPAAIRKITDRIKADFIPFAAGKPAPGLFPLEMIYQQTGALLETHGGEALQYSGTAGYEPLRQWIAGRVPPASAAEVCIVSGSQQAIDLVGKVLIDPGDKVVVSAPTYTAAITSLNVYGPEFVSVPCDNEGMLPEALEAALRQRPKLLYTNPNFMNPSGVCMSLARRQNIIELARKYDVPIMEDDPYGELRFAGEPLPNLFELAPELVIYAGTFSKIVAPGMRVGWLIASAEGLEKLTIAKQTSDLQTGTYQQLLLYGLVEGLDLPAHIQRVRDYYQRQCEVMLEAMGKHFPAAVRYEPPAGGMFIWCELPLGLNTTEILELALEKKVAYIPGEAFFANGQGQNTLRLSYSLATEAQIRVGIKILGDVFRQVLANHDKAD